MKIRSLFSLFLAAGIALTPCGVYSQGRVGVGNREDERRPGAQRPNPGAARNPITGSSVKNRPNPNQNNNPNRRPAGNNNNAPNRPAPKGNNNNNPNPRPNPNPNQRPNPNPNPNPRPNPNPATKPAPSPGRVGVPETRPAPMPNPRPNPDAGKGKGNPNNPNNPNAGKNKEGNNPPKPRPNPPANANRNPNANKPNPKRNDFVPGKVVYPSRVGTPVAKTRPAPNPNHPARRPNRARPQNLSQVIATNSNVNSNNRTTNVTNVTNNNTYVNNNWGNQWTNNRTTVWNNNRVVNNRPVVINQNFQRSVNYAYRPASWGARPWWSSSTYHTWHHGSWNYGWNRTWHSYHVTRPVYVNYFPGYRPAPAPATVAAWGIAAWSLGSLAYDMGYNSYRNPYPAPPVQTQTTVINYTQPLSVVASREQPAPEPEALSAEEKSTAATARARDEFSNGDYLAAQKSIDEAISWVPGDTTLHEFRALCLFALGKYGEAAGVLNPVLASGPGWDWSTMSAFYPSGDTYTAQLRRLEDFVASHPDSADCHFLLGYHYMVAGFIDEAYNMFDRVVTLQPADTVSAQLRALAQSSSEEDAGDEAAAATDATPAATGLAPDAVVEPIDPVDLEGGWNSVSPDGKAITLTLGADGNFTWNYEGAADAKVLSGEWSIDDEGRLVLASTDVQMVAVISLQDTTLRFVLAGSPVDDPGLTFQKL